MSGDRPFIPDRWALPVAALSLDASIDETQRLVDEGVIDLADYHTIERESVRRLLAQLARLEAGSL